MATSLFSINLGLESEYETWINDMLKVFTFRVVQHVLINYISGKGTKNLFNADWVNNTVAILIGLSVYYLIVKKSVKVSNDSKDKFLNF